MPASFTVIVWHPHLRLLTILLDLQCGLYALDAAKRAYTHGQPLNFLDHLTPESLHFMRFGEYIAAAAPQSQEGQCRHPRAASRQLQLLQSLCHGLHC